MQEQEIERTMRAVYAAFNQRDIDGCLQYMTGDVHWPKASEGGTVVGKEEIRAYWTRQWSEFDPYVEPIEILMAADGKVRVRVHQVVRSLSGDLLFDGEVLHVYAMREGCISAMTLGEADADGKASAAFARQH
ncbi:nuclear transport factor 2 family protein [Terriglobus aquaticus]|uniref:Nuclear transport factor 2 family protein n=1 Tax=Terriglobus aquaticus TaxID=940139 RepID=A0ABW9KKV0_9BACT|nr:nuclear transport factor 2 family protein [Terriglobus aquaticus]